MCGIICCIDAMQNNRHVLDGLLSIGHRGHESFGFEFFNDDLEGESFLHKYNICDIKDHDKDQIYNINKSYRYAFGHVRYATTGMDIPENIQPMRYSFNEKNICLVFNGNVYNHQKIREHLIKYGMSFNTDSDTETICAVILYAFEKYSKEDALQYVQKQLLGGFAIIFYFEGSVFVIRDKFFIRPLSISKVPGGGYLLASEDYFFDSLSLNQDNMPDEEIVEFCDNKIIVHNSAENASRKVCAFEYIYFAHKMSRMRGVFVNYFRFQIGILLAQKYPPSMHSIVVPVPESSISYAHGYSYASGIPVSLAIVKRPRISRTFILDHRTRADVIKNKFYFDREKIDGQRMILIDDSIVRGSTLKHIVSQLRDCGAMDIDVIVGSPKVTHPCLYGINTPDSNELIANTESNISEYFGVNSIKYLELEDMIHMMINNTELCHACFSGKYCI